MVDFYTKQQIENNERKINDVERRINDVNRKVDEIVHPYWGPINNLKNKLL